MLSGNENENEDEDERIAETLVGSTTRTVPSDELRTAPIAMSVVSHPRSQLLLASRMHRQMSSQLARSTQSPLDVLRVTSNVYMGALRECAGHKRVRFKLCCAIRRFCGSAILISCLRPVQPLPTPPRSHHLLPTPPLHCRCIHHMTLHPRALSSDSS